MDRSVRPRPPWLRALGRNEPPTQIEIAGRAYYLVDVFKHDSWAATARYLSRDGRADGDVVCKFNRVQPIVGLPMRWLGRRLARREAFALKRLVGLPGIPAVCEPVFANAQLLANAVAHRFVAGHPLGSDERVADCFFPTLAGLLHEVHRRGMAYVDLHKRENILVGDDHRPYLIDFQVSFVVNVRRSDSPARPHKVLHALQQADWYHLSKHWRRHRPDQLDALALDGFERRPWWIDLHRSIAVPLRQGRRRLLAALGVRGKSGRAVTETFAEHAFRSEQSRAA